MVLDMDKLSRHRSMLDCYKKEVKFHRQGKLEVKFRGIRRELSSSMISAWKRKECCVRVVRVI